MQKIILSMLIFLLTATASYAENITKTIKSLKINPSSVSVSVKDVNTGAIIYSFNDKTPSNPASTLKLITSSAALDTLGDDYKFKTVLYKSINNDLYLKLGADPFLTKKDLTTLISTAKSKNINEPKNIYIDDTIFDKIEWGEGWQWDDELNPYMQKFSSYNLDKNLINIEISPKINNTSPIIQINPFYPLTIMNLVNTDYKNKLNDVRVEKNSSIAPNIISVSGTVSSFTQINIPVYNTQLYFKLRLEEAIKSKKMGYYNPIKYAKTPEKNIYKVEEISHDISQAMDAILKNSDNLAAETVYKLAGAVWANDQGNIENSTKMLNSYLEKMNLLNQDIKIVDGSGVSKNNIINSDFMTDFLVKRSKMEDFEEFENFMSSPGEGTLKNRMLYFSNNLKAKTGTLSNVSAIAGYIKNRKGKIYAFDIMIEDAKTSNTDKKNIEEQILRQIYVN